jgi:hypothetical protein
MPAPHEFFDHTGIRSWGDHRKTLGDYRHVIASNAPVADPLTNCRRYFQLTPSRSTLRLRCLLLFADKGKASMVGPMNRGDRAGRSFRETNPPK